MQEIGSTGGSLELAASDDGTTYSTISDSLNTDAGAYTRFSFDLDQQLFDAGIALDSDVYLRFRHNTRRVGYDLTLDDVRVSDVDVFGPSIISHSPLGESAGPISSFQVTFEDYQNQHAINSASFTADDVTVSGPTGNPIDLAQDPVDAGDGLTFTINFATAHSLSGEYQFTIGPDVVDLVGNPMNQNGDPVTGGSNDSYHGTFHIGPPMSQVAPHSEGFEAASVGDLAAWSFTADAGMISITDDDNPYGGSRHLKFDQTVDSSDLDREAILRLDLSSQVGATDLSLDFWMQEVGPPSGSLSLAVSGDGTTYSTIASSLNTNADEYTQFQ